MNRLGAEPSATKTITQETLKLCTLCGTLNHLNNAECWTCRWHGKFSREEQTISLAWQRLQLLYEDVRLEHVTSQKIRALGDFGAFNPRSRWQVWVDHCRAWWSACQTNRDLRMAQRAARLRSHVSP